VIARHHFEPRGTAKYKPCNEPGGRDMADSSTLSPAKLGLFPALLKVAESELAQRLHCTTLGERLSENDRHFVAVFAASFLCGQLMASRDGKLREPEWVSFENHRAHG
jgi:hypothetical protein